MKRKDIVKITTGSKALDEALQGGMGILKFNISQNNAA